MELSKNLIKVCEEKGMSVTSLARESGVRQSTIHGWVTGRSVRKLGDLKKVCNVMQVSLHFIVFSSEDPWHRQK